MTKFELSTQHPDVWGQALDALRRTAVPGERAGALAWLSGETGDESVDAMEERARRTLMTLGHLLRHDRPLVVCFDQLESLADGDDGRLLRAFGRLVFHLFNDVPSMMIVAAVRGEKWRAMRTQLDAAALQRLESSRFRLRPCDAGWARRLIASRLATLGLPADAPPLFPFDRPPWSELLEEALGAGALSARLVLQKANRLWHRCVGAPLPPEEPARVLSAWVARERARVLAERDGEAGDGTLEEALRLQLRALGAPRPDCLTVKVALSAEEAAHWRAVVSAHQAVLAGDLTAVDAGGLPVVLGSPHFDHYLANMESLPRFAEVHELLAGPGGLRERLRERAIGLLLEDPARMMTAGQLLTRLPADLRARCGAAGAFVAALEGSPRISRFGRPERPEDIVLGVLSSAAWEKR